MKIITLTLVFALSIMIANAQNTNSTKVDSLESSHIVDSSAINSINPANSKQYKLYPTKNTWTFIKLNTRTGTMTHVQYSIENAPFEYSLGSPYSTFDDEYISLTENGRFTLFPTQNTYNFILLDQFDGQTWQVQWSQDEETRFVIPINYSFGS